MRKGDYIYLVNGKRFYFQDPRPEDFTIEVIAHSTSLTCRFGGQCSTFYSIAQHQILVASRLRKHALRGLLHDGSEGFIHDIVKPLKNVIEPIYGPIEKKIQDCIYKRFGLDPDDIYGERAVKNADMRMLVTEIPQLIPKRTKSNKKSYMNLYKPYNLKITPWEPKKARDNYLKAFYLLTS